MNVWRWFHWLSLGAGLSVGELLFLSGIVEPKPDVVWVYVWALPLTLLLIAFAAGWSYRVEKSQSEQAGKPGEAKK